MLVEIMLVEIMLVEIMLVEIMLVILIGVVYVMIFYVVSALVRILVGRGALSDPTESVDGARYKVRYDVEDLYEYTGDESPHRGLSRSEDHKVPLGGNAGMDTLKASRSMASSGATILVRVGRNMERRVNRITPKLKRAVTNIASAVSDHSPGSHSVVANDHSPARPR
ncbi:hypothetical protein T484DRAFT_1758132, partial [Baffinella frigidus]